LKLSKDLAVTDPERIYVGGAAAFRGFIRIEPDLLETIPTNALISRADITLSIDYDKSILPNGNSAETGILFVLRYGFVDSLSSTGVPVKINRADSLTVPPIDGNSITLNFTPFVQQWIAGNIDNFGIAFWSSGEHSQLYRISFISGDSMDDDALKPKINIYYIEPPDFSQ